MSLICTVKSELGNQQEIEISNHTSPLNPDFIAYLGRALGIPDPGSLWDMSTNMVATSCKPDHVYLLRRIEPPPNIPTLDSLSMPSTQAPRSQRNTELQQLLAERMRSIQQYCPTPTPMLPDTSSPSPTPSDEIGVGHEAQHNMMNMVETNSYSASSEEQQQNMETDTFQHGAGTADIDPFMEPPAGGVVQPIGGVMLRQYVPNHHNTNHSISPASGRRETLRMHTPSSPKHSRRRSSSATSSRRQRPAWRYVASKKPVREPPPLWSEIALPEVDAGKDGMSEMLKLTNGMVGARATNLWVQQLRSPEKMRKKRDAPAKYVHGRCGSRSGRYTASSDNYSVISNRQAPGYDANWEVRHLMRTQSPSVSSWAGNLCEQKKDGATSWKR
eukprot:TRINITY_DN85181_c0_g1_i1.p1 TRINITY_DN85181_c0_g1~~TRINITY_DN85181_c0_g1_i1.p1  ORF type:complete len:397 (-),score=26.00 TRINITY_DN85181_c0_g1_i1:261-1421(-)